VVQIDQSLLRSEDSASAAGSFIDTLQSNERQHVLRALNETDWVIHGKRGSAELLGINPSTLRSRIEKLAIKRPA
jgi:formate hydrogenlyase transcriptional activator